MNEQLEMWDLRPFLSQGMVNILGWNVRGRNGSNKQKEVKLLSNEEQVELIGLLETKIKINKIEKLVEKLFGGW